MVRRRVRDYIRVAAFSQLAFIRCLSIGFSSVVVYFSTPGFDGQITIRIAFCRNYVDAAA
ncbi:hypothetical protein HPP92_001270 [Vanilla planifolia]|uniref:Uncharacterized protein n=1 Tax=Vanilla planifolia TaxID=51239 RepID=A0A835SCC7_VANPL|nr:hypothetical protein HPP92_001270 [Vanilla planifolia]